VEESTEQCRHHKAVLMARVTDPPGYGNYIRYFTKTNRDDFYPGSNSVYDDQIIDGKTYDVQIDQGVSHGMQNQPVKIMVILKEEIR
jgi:hypothetical protein